MQDTAETESKLEGALKPTGRGPIPKRPVMGIISHYQLQCCPHGTVFTEISSQPQLQLSGTALARDHQEGSAMRMAPPGGCTEHAGQLCRLSPAGL